MENNPSLFLLLHRLWRHISVRRRRQLVTVGGLMLLGTGTELVSLGIVVPFLGALTAPERFMEHPWAQPALLWLGLITKQQVLLALTGLFCVAALLSGATRLALLWSQTRLANAIGNDLGTDLYRRTIYQPYLVQISRNGSEIVAALMTKINTIVYFIIIPFLTLITAILVTFTILGFMFFIDPGLTGMAFISIGGLYVIVASAAKKQLARDGRRVTERQSRVARVVQEGLGGIRDVLIGGLQETFARLYYLADSELRRSLSNIAILGGAPRPVIEAFGLALIGILLFITLKQREAATVIPLLGALALSAQRVLPLVQNGFAGWTSMLGGRDSLRDVLTLLEQPLPKDDAPPPVPIEFKREIRLVDLQFRYDSEKTIVLDGINLRIPKGGRVGFIGATGSGKSTLLDVVMGLLSPTAGSVQVDGIRLDERNRRAWQAHIAHVPQSIFLADTTIAENIAFGVPAEAIDWDQVREAARMAQIAETIESLQFGYDTSVGERGIRLSGGQRQRIGIARALYKQADVIVFDEATSALDSDTENQVMKAIDALHNGLTILIVTHRITTLRNCDQIVYLHGGSVRRIGSYQEMVAGASGENGLPDFGYTSPISIDSRGAK